LRKEVVLRKREEALEFMSRMKLMKRGVEGLHRYTRERRTIRAAEEAVKREERGRLLESQEFERVKEEALWYSPAEERQRANSARAILSHRLRKNVFMAWVEHGLRYWDQKCEIREKSDRLKAKLVFRAFRAKIDRAKQCETLITERLLYRQRILVKKSFRELKKLHRLSKKPILAERLKKYWILAQRKIFKKWQRTMRHREIIYEQVSFLQRKKTYRLLKTSFKAIKYSLQQSKNEQQSISKIFHLRDVKKMKSAWVKWQQNQRLVGDYNKMKATWRCRRLELFFGKLYENFYDRRKNSRMAAVLQGVFEASWAREYQASFDLMRYEMLKVRRVNGAYNNLRDQISMRRKKFVFAGLYSNYLGKILERKNWYKRDNVAKKAGIADIECALDQADLCETNLDINLVELRGANEQLNSDMNHRNSELSSVKKELERLATGILMVNEDIKEITRAFEVTHQL
jgi:hypothetical protein